MILNIFLDLDKEIFYWINSDLSNWIFDFYLPVLRNKLTWIPVYIFIISYILFNFSKKESWKVILFLLCTVALSDLTSSHLIKKNVQRLRPCNNELTISISRVHCGSGYSFTSSHAANHFAISFFLIFMVAKRRIVKTILFLWAFLVSFSQVYVGVHYPLDVLGGAILGIFIAWIMYKVLNRWNASKGEIITA